ncbi:YbaB/EbfC family nucleoid-associated protein [Anaerococcus vaginalis]|uniref:YbaB/EbfC family nucleoid-associated protein n=1 Tax=Anaerococcus vaginalis TaxID=33037 RepID=UPI00291438F7|nr:YbaB/EbfC family nucleoid-associated protein [Anaerococcus vaginalis]MDU6547309.1 YbaB/EbfC family nucleoid-associated protein [Anaerococcus vaginalis]
MARGGFPGGGNMNSMMKKVQKMQQEMARTQQEIEEKEFSSTAGGGVIEAVVNGKKEVVKIKIDEDLVVAAINDALKKADEYSQKEMGKLTGNINIPGLM